jgi:hypothetical protein
MSSRNLARPIFPLAPEEYSREYMDRLVQSFAVYLEQYQNPGEGRTTKSVMTNIPTTPVGSEDGTVWVDSTILRVGTGGTPGTFVIPNLEVTTLLDVSGTLDITGVFDIAGTTVTASAVELNYNDITTLGTVQEDKTVTAGTGKAINFDDAPMTNVDINSGAIDGTPIGAASANTGSFTNLGSTGTATFSTANITSTFQLSGTTVTATAAELNYNDIATLGTVEENKTVTAGTGRAINFNTAPMTNVDINSGTIDGTPIGAASASTGVFTTLNTTTTFQLAGTTVTATASELNYNDISTLGTVEENKTVTAGTGRAINFNTAPMTNVDINSGTIDGTPIGDSVRSTGKFTTFDANSTFSLNGTTVTATASELNVLDGITATTTELNYNDITTLGVVQPSKVVTADGSGNVNFNNFNLLNVDINSGAIDGTTIGAASPANGTFSVLTATTLNLTGIRFVLPTLTTAVRDSIGAPVAGWLIYNTTTNKLNFYNGTAWEQVTSA